MAINHRMSALLLACCAVLPASGCLRRHTIEPGSWRLSIEAVKTNPQSKAYEPKPRDVEVAVEWGSEKGTEDLRVFYEGRTEVGAQTREMKGSIKEGNVDLQGYDQDWVIKIWGKVNDPQSMNGNAYGRGRINDSANFEGTWTMVKAKPE